MSLGAGTRLSLYEVLKVLPPAVSADADRLARSRAKLRFSRLSNHPNIARVYGLETS